MNWSWGAFFFSTAEFVRWRQSGLAFLNFCFAIASAAVCLYLALGGVWWVYWIYVALSYGLLPLAFNSLVQKQTPKVESKLSMGMTWAAGAACGLLLPYSMMVTSDYFTQFQIRDTIAITENRLRLFYEKEKRLPDRRDTQAFAQRVGDQVHLWQTWDEDRRVLQVEFETTTHHRLRSRYILKPEVTPEGLSVTCYNVTIPDRWLTAKCREPWK